jgi:hypothetical protein
MKKRSGNPKPPTPPRDHPWRKWDYGNEQNRPKFPPPNPKVDTAVTA